MKLELFTIVLDGMPFITSIWPELQKLRCDWRWHIVEGVAGNTADTHWVAPMVPRLSEDGTTGYIQSIAAFDKRICIYQRDRWLNKTVMVNQPLRTMYEPALLVQVDSDEYWTADQFMKMREMFMADKTKNCAWFRCDFRLGANIRITSRDTFGNNTTYEWKRAWRFMPGMRFASHEPPKIENFQENAFTHDETEKAGLVFTHYSYATEAQVAMKCQYYGSENNKVGHLYKNGIEGWMRLQDNREWPVKDVSRFMPWMGKGVVADLVNK